MTPLPRIGGQAPAARGSDHETCAWESSRIGALKTPPRPGGRALLPWERRGTPATIAAALSTGRTVLEPGRDTRTVMRPGDQNPINQSRALPGSALDIPAEPLSG